MSQKKKDLEGELRTALVQAVLHGHSEAAGKAGSALARHFKAKKKFGPQALDFLVPDESKVPDEFKTHSPLMMALEKKQSDIAQKLVELGASVAFKNKDGLTALHIACNQGSPNTTRFLLTTAQTQKRFCRKKKSDKKPDQNNDCEVVINAKERPQGWTPLMYAAKGSHLDTIKELMKYPSLKYDVKNKKQQNVYHVVVREGRLECLKYLCTPSDDYPLLTQDIITTACLSKDKKNWNLLHQACTRKEVELLKWLLENIPGLKAEDNLNQKSEIGSTPLLVACEYEHLDIVKHLTTDEFLKVDVNACSHSDGEGEGISCLHLAAIHNSQEMTEVLIEAGCKLDCRDAEGNTILHVANMRANLKVARFIIEKCKEVEVNLEIMKNKDGKLPSEVEEEIVVPLEILKLGQEAVEIYMKALEEGREKIPYCGLLILGEEQVGKTSLYRQLVGKEFKKDLDSTRGIDNNTVDTVDQRHVDTGKWKEEDEPASGEQFTTALAGEVASRLPDDAPKDEKGKEMVTNEDLMKRIDEITQEITKMKEKSKTQSEQHRVKSTTPAFPRESHPSKPVPKSLPPQSPKQTPPESSPPSKKPKIDEDKERPQPLNKPEDRNRQIKIAMPKPIEEPPPPSLDESDSMAIPETAEDPSPSDANPEENPRKQEAGLLNPKQATVFKDRIKNRGKFKKKEPSLVLNALDFAGQEEYRPMHHCFISRRALYVVVFKIPDVLDFINGKSKSNPLEEVRYWIYSIHAHIYPPDEDLKDVDEKINRVFLVGTHRGDPPRPQNELEKIDDLIYTTLIEKKKEGVNPCINHIHPFGKKSLTKYFLAVENSIDCIKDENYLTNSGTEFLQDQIKEKSKMMPTLNDDHPIKWLKFEERLKKYRESRKPAPVMKMEEARELAAKSRIIAKDEQDLALRFFHDTGKIICLRYLPRLFLSPKELEELVHLVVLHPHWLISVMKVIMELNIKEFSGTLKQSQIQILKEEGIADLEVLEECWKQFMSVPGSPPDIEIRHLCLILQAYCLIYPVPQSPASTSTSEEPQEEKVQKYIIPCKLPKNFSEYRVPKITNWTTFFFEFEYFLPDEIYHRILCLASSEAKPPRKKCSIYSNKRCLYYGLFETNWIFEIEREKQRLKFMVIMKKGKKFTEYVLFIHNYLYKICKNSGEGGGKESGLRGLTFHGGPEVTCCGETTVLECVYYDSNEEGCEKEVNSNPACDDCGMEYEVNELFKYKAPQAQPKEKDSAPSTTQLLTEKHHRKVCDLLRELDPNDCRIVGGALGLYHFTLKKISDDKLPDDMVGAWLKGDDNVLRTAADGGDSRTWGGLIDALEKQHHGGIAKKVRAYQEEEDKLKLSV